MGLPLSRFHSLEEFGAITGDFEIGFDPLGRLFTVQNGTFSVLNDRNWVYLTEFENSTEVIQSILQLSETEVYYGASGSWGKMIRTPSGGLRPSSTAPEDRPTWSKSTSYLILFPFRDSICIANWNGIVVWNKFTDHHDYIEITELTDAFALNDELYISSTTQGLQRVDLFDGSLHTIDNLDLFERIFYNHTPYDENSLLCATRNNGFSVFDGEKLKPWTSDLDLLRNFRVTSICRLPEQDFAVSLESGGLFILNSDGKIIASYTTPEFQNIRKIISKEPGILWFSTDSGIQQIYYGSRVSIVDKRQGIPINWPQVANWNGKTVIASNGRLYDSEIDRLTQATVFQRVSNQPVYGTWGIANFGDMLLTGNKEGVFQRTEENVFNPILPGFQTDRLVAVGPETCFAIGKDEITLLHFENDRWVESAPRIPGVGYPTVVHRAGTSAWIELGVHRVARVYQHDGQISTQVFDKFPWKEAGWIHIGVVGKLVILSSPTEGRLFFDEATGDFIDTPECWKFLDTLPYLLGRMLEDSNGNIWVSHFQGISKMNLKDGSYKIDTSGFEFVRASYPIIRLVNGNDVWFNTGSNLYHVNSTGQALPFSEPDLTLVSITDQRTGKVLKTQIDESDPLNLKYRQNNLSFRLFAGTYAVRTPRYQIQIRGTYPDWTMTEANSEITLPNLSEGKYELSCQLTDNQIQIGTPVTFHFQIAPPWYRSWVAYLCYLASGLSGFYVIIRWLFRRTHRHNRLLSKLVAERTQALEDTMEKLNQETRNAATLAERDRLAGEIHDSVQQGLTGLMIHLDGVMRSPLMCDELRPSLGTARKMVDYTRQEVQHALLDMQSPLLKESDLSIALSRIAQIIPQSSASVQIEVEGIPMHIPSTTAHQLLRIGQEAMTNAVRHGNASLIQVRLEYQTNALILSIHDDGNGFDTHSNLDRNLHFGLRGMRNRAKSIGSKLTIESQPGQGTHIHVQVPLVVEPHPE